ERALLVLCCLQLLTQIVEPAFAKTQSTLSFLELALLACDLRALRSELERLDLHELGGFGAVRRRRARRRACGGRVTIGFEQGLHRFRETIQFAASGIERHVERLVLAV